MAAAMFAVGAILAALLPSSVPFWHQALVPFLFGCLPYIAELVTPFLIALVLSPKLIPTLAEMRWRRAAVRVRRAYIWLRESP